MTITALIDGDWILYAAGFAGQKTKYVCPSLFGQQEYGTMTELKSAVLEGYDKAIDDDCPVYKRDILDPESHFYHSAKMMIERNCEKIAEKFGEEVRPVILIDGDGNFRSKLATIKPYKGTRSVHAKPIMYNQIRQYLLDCWDAEVVHDQETDDEMAIRQTAMGCGNRSIIVSIDKDMMQVPGWHMNPNKGFKCINEREALERLYVQCLQGDTVDNIGGCWKVGPKKARAIITHDLNEWDMWLMTASTYNESIARYGSDIYNGSTGAQAALENMRLVYLRRKPDEIWMPPEAS